MKQNYLSYLLRVWLTAGAGSPRWVASLEDPHTHKVTHFGSVPELIQFLQQSTDHRGVGPMPSGEPEKNETE